MKRTLETISVRNSYEQWLPALETSSREVFRMVLGAELGSCSPQPWKGSEFTAMVGLAGDLCGLLSLRCRRESATLVAASMLDLAPENAAEHACDAIEEVANMIAGNFKNGHTDNVPIHNSRFALNWDLSIARATTTVRLLSSEL